LPRDKSARLHRGGISRCGLSAAGDRRINGDGEPYQFGAPVRSRLGVDGLELRFHGLLAYPAAFGNLACRKALEHKPAQLAFRFRQAKQARQAIDRQDAMIFGIDNEHDRAGELALDFILAVTQRRNLDQEGSQRALALGKKDGFVRTALALCGERDRFQLLQDANIDELNGAAVASPVAKLRNPVFARWIPCLRS
jgi:hypothetical protein